MRVTQILLGGGRHFHYPTSVWSPAGGWWKKYPANWQRNTMLGFTIIGISCVTLSIATSDKEVRPVTPI